MIRLQHYLLMKGKDLNRSILKVVPSDKSWSLGVLESWNEAHIACRAMNGARRGHKIIAWSAKPLHFKVVF